METQPKRSYKRMKGLMPSGKISEEYVNNMVKKLSGTEQAVGLNDKQLRKKIINEIKMSKKIADGESMIGRKPNRYGGMQTREQRSYGGNSRMKKNTGGRSMYNKGGQPHYSNGEMPTAKPN